MHELSVTENVLSIVERHAKEAGATRVTRIHLVIGDLSSIVDDSVQFYFDLLSQDTCVEGAQLDFHRIATQVECQHCGATWSPKGGDWTCPKCGLARAKVIAGREFFVESIEVE